jgi:CspA family cold shock protein
LEILAVLWDQPSAKGHEIYDVVLDTGCLRLPSAEFISWCQVHGQLSLQDHVALHTLLQNLPDHCSPLKDVSPMQGTIKSLHTERGFGFIRDVQGGEVFFHHTALPSPDHFAALAIGTMVEFEAELGPKGPRATRVTRLPAPR